MKTIATSILCFSLVSACGSTATVDSAQVPNKTLPQPVAQAEVVDKSPVIPDIYQHYSASYDAVSAKTHTLAQFRVADRRGHTIRFTENEEISVSEVPLRMIDGDKVNLVADLLTHLTLIPIFQIFKTGTFYTDTHEYPTAPEFYFRDSQGNEVYTAVSIPEVELEQLAPLVSDDEYKVGMTLGADAHSVEVDCGLESEGQAAEEALVPESEEVDAQSRREFQLVKTRGVVDGQKAECHFSSDDLEKLGGALEKLTAVLEVSKSLRNLDEFGRLRMTRSSWNYKARVQDHR